MAAGGRPTIPPSHHGRQKNPFGSVSYRLRRTYLRASRDGFIPNTGVIMLSKFTAALLVSAAISTCAYAQTPAPQSAALSQSAAPLVVGHPAEQSNVLRAGTEINMRTRTELSSRTSRVGERFELEVTDPVTLDGQAVIPAGSVAVGEVTRVRHKGMWGRRGILETRLVHVRVGDRQIRISGAAGDRGRAGTAGVVAAVVFVPVVGFFVTGTSAVIAPGTSTVGYTEEDIPVVFAGPVQSQPLVVPATTPSPAPSASQE